MYCLKLILQIIASVPYDWPRARLVASALARILIVPFLMMCATPRRDPYLSGEAWSMVLSAVLGITNGYFGSVPMILAPSKVPDEQKELTGEATVVLFCFLYLCLSVNLPLVFHTTHTELSTCICTCMAHAHTHKNTGGPECTEQCNKQCLYVVCVCARNEKILAKGGPCAGTIHVI